MPIKIKLNPENNVPIFKQIVSQIQIALESGELKALAKLPSIRTLASELSLSPNTVHKAYRHLELSGFIQANTKSSYVVASSVQSQRYQRRGVSPSKTEVHRAVDKLDQGPFPGAFCKITEDILGGDPSRCNVIHSDGSGTKSILAYLYYRETGDAKVFEGIAQDSIVMNLDDLLCIGAADRILISSTINRNAHLCPGEVIAALIGGNEKFIQKMRDFGVGLYSGGGETADMGDCIRTVSVDTCAVATLEKKQVIRGNMGAGLAIVGLSSSGQANYEDFENSGMGSNGLTSARHDLLNSYYKETYPEACDPDLDDDLVYCGPHRLDATLPGSSLTVGEALLSPTRTYAPIILKLLEEHRDKVVGLIHCSGGAQTKCLRFGDGVHFVKDNLFEIPPLFKEIKRVTDTPFKEMYQVFNMGHRMEVYCDPADAQMVIDLSESMGVEAKKVGYTEKSLQKNGGNHLSIKLGEEVLEY